MLEQEKSSIPIRPDQILNIVIRRKWIIIIPLCISLTVGLFITLTTDKTYEASTLILVQPQKVPTDFIRSVVSADINQRISTISQQILSRSNLEKIIDQFGLYEDKMDMYLEDKIASMRKRVKVKIERARHGAEAFSIGFLGSQPDRVMRVANTLASYFMDENLKFREAQAIGTSEFLDSELEKTKRRLEGKEQRLADFRQKHLGGLPDELESNLRTLDRLQVQLTDKHNALRDTKNALNMVETQISRTKDLIATKNKEELAKLDMGSANEEFVKSEDEEQLEAAQESRDALLLKYTEKHPDVQRMIRTIEKLEASIKESNETNSVDSGGDDSNGVASETKSSKDNFMFFKEQMQIKHLKNEINKINSDISYIQNQMKIYQQRVEETPKREQELQSLRRDYTNIQGVYNSLLDRKLEAELSVNMEKKQKGEQFRILDHARLPEKPIKPNVKMLLLITIAVGFGIGGGISFLLEIMDSSVSSDEQIEKELGLAILASIPPIKQPRGWIKERGGYVIFSLCILYAATFLIFFAILNYKGLDRTINFIKMNIPF